MGASQASVFDAIGDESVQNIFHGVNSTIFAYGQTSSGKTFSLQGVPDGGPLVGLMPRLVNLLFAAIEKVSSKTDAASKRSYFVEASYLEICESSAICLPIITMTIDDYHGF